MNDHTLAAEYINAGYNHKTILSDCLLYTSDAADD